MSRWLAGLAVRGVLAAARAELLQLDAVGIVAAVLARDVVAFLALHTRHRDLWTNIGRLGHGWSALLADSGYGGVAQVACCWRGSVRSGGRNRTGDTAIMSRLLCRLSYTAVEPPYGIEP